MCPTQQEKIAEGTIAALSYPDVKTATHEVWHSVTQDGTARVIVDVCYHCITVTTVETDGVIVVVIEERLMLSINKSIVFLPLLFGQGTD